MAVLVALAVLAAVVVVPLLWIRATYGVWGIGSEPQRISICEEQYRNGDTGTVTYAEATAMTLDPPPLVFEPAFGRIPIIVGKPDRFVRGAAYNGCGSYILLHVGDDAYVMYGKAGGP